MMSIFHKQDGGKQEKIRSFLMTGVKLPSFTREERVFMLNIRRYMVGVRKTCFCVGGGMTINFCPLIVYTSGPGDWQRSRLKSHAVIVIPSHPASCGCEFKEKGAPESSQSN